MCILGPLVQFLLLEPQQSPQFTQLRGQLTRSLLQVSKVKATRVKVMEYLLDLVPCLQVGVWNEHPFGKWDSHEKE